MEYKLTEKNNQAYCDMVTLLWLSGQKKAIQKLTDALSNKIGYKCEFDFSTYHSHIYVPKEGCDKAIKTIGDIEFIKDFVVPYSKES